MNQLSYLAANELLEELNLDKPKLPEEVRVKIIDLSNRQDTFIVALYGLYLKKSHLTQKEAEEYLQKNYNFSPILTSWVENNLTQSEAKLFQTLLSKLGKIVNRDELGQALWGENWIEKYSDWMIDTEIYNLRRKIIEPWKISTARGKGYRLYQEGPKLPKTDFDNEPTITSPGTHATASYIRYMNDPNSVRKTLKDLFLAIEKAKLHNVVSQTIVSKEIKVLVVNSYSFDNIDAAYLMLPKLLPNRSIRTYFTHFDDQALKIHQQRIAELKIENIEAIYDDIRETRLRPDSFDIVINDFRLNFNTNHIQNKKAMTSMAKVLKKNSIALVSVVVDARYESTRYGKDQEKAPINKNSPWTFMADEALPRRCFPVPYYKQLFRKHGYKIVSEFDLKEGRNWLKNFKKVENNKGPIYRRFILKKI